MNCPSIQPSPADQIDPQAVEVVRVTRDSLGEAKSLLFHAYREEPSFRHLFEEHSEGYEQRVRAALREGMERHFANQGDVIGLAHEHHLVGVAFINSPAFRKTLDEQLNWRLKMFLTIGLGATRRYLDYREQVRACFPDNYHYLHYVAVHPRYQGQGFGRRMIDLAEQICRESDGGTSGIGVDTGNPRHIEMSQRWGFEQVGEVALGDLKQAVFFKALD